MGISDPSRWRDSLVIEICCWNGLHDVDPYHDLMGEAKVERDARKAAS